MTRQYYAWAGGTPDDHAALARMSAAGPADMGPLLASFRGGFSARALGRSLALLALAYTLSGDTFGLGRWWGREVGNGPLR